MTTPSDMTGGEEPRLPDILPVLALKNAVVFPFLILPLSVSRERSIRAVDQALAENRILMLVTQRDPSVEEPTAEDLGDTGTAALVLRMLKLPDGRTWQQLAQVVQSIWAVTSSANHCTTDMSCSSSRSKLDLIQARKAQFSSWSSSAKHRTLVESVTNLMLVLHGHRRQSPIQAMASLR